MFELKNVSKKFGSEYALKNVEMTIGKGLQFIVGTSGSGKTTLLKILSGMDQDFDGDAFYLGKSIKSLKEEEKAYLYNHILGFVWQDFQLLEDMTVEENILLPRYLKKNQSQVQLEKVLKQLRIEDLRYEKVKRLSGGQKQRVAIARELIKNPQVILADEPTSALDEKVSKEVLDILRELAKEKAVIIITHDQNLITKEDLVYELEKGELISQPEKSITTKKNLVMNQEKELGFKEAYKLGFSHLKSKLARTLTTSVASILASLLLVTSLSGSINASGEDAFKQLIETYGESLLDIHVVGNFMSGQSQEEDDRPKSDVDQDISGLYEIYLKDERVEYLLFSDAFDEISITLDSKKYKIPSSSTVPSANKFIIGRSPQNKGEVVVPENFVKQVGMRVEEALGKKIQFEASVYNWDSGQPIPKPIQAEATIVGVVDTTVKQEIMGKVMEYSIDDSFFFDKGTLDELNKQADRGSRSSSFMIRPKTPKDMIAIKDELNARGIVPIGQFKLVENIVRLNEQTTNQSSGMTMVVGVLAIVGLGVIGVMTAIMRKRDYAICKIAGYGQKDLGVETVAETSILFGLTTLLFLILTPVLGSPVEKLLGIQLLESKTLIITVGMIAVGIIGCGLMSYAVGCVTKPLTVLKSGGK